MAGEHTEYSVEKMATPVHQSKGEDGFSLKLVNVSFS